MKSSNFTPIFVSGSARSGTTLVTHILATHPECGTYRAETLLLSVCRTKYGDIFSSNKNREVFLRDWFRSRQFRESKLSRNEFLTLLELSGNYEQLTLNFLSSVSLKRSSRYIVDSTPANVPYLTKLYKEYNGSKFINVVRDGRDVAISQVKLGWSNPPFPYKSKGDHLHYALLKWADVLDSIERQSQFLDILQVKYEELLKHPTEFAKATQEYLDLPEPGLDISKLNQYEDANSAFGRLGEPANNSPVGRWKALDDGTLKNMTYGLSDKLNAFGYETSPQKFSARLELRFFLFKFHIKLKRMLVKIPLLGRFSSLSLEINS